MSSFSGLKMADDFASQYIAQVMMGSNKDLYECIKAFSETDFTEDLKKITVPTLVMHGDDDQIVPIDASAKQSIKLLKNDTLKIYKGLPHGMCTTHPDIINADLLSFIKSGKVENAITAQAG